MKICYLCSKKIISEDEVSKDHVVPRQFIRRKQPKVKGFHFAGILPTHTKCNNEFGPEKYGQKALIALNALYNESCFLKYEMGNNKATLLNPECFPGFTDADLKFFKIIYLPSLPAEIDSNIFKDKPKTNMMRDAINIVLSVLSKSSAALLLSKKLISIPSEWRIVVSAFHGAEPVDFDSIFEKTSEFETGVKAWIRQTEFNDWMVIYKVNGIILYMLFLISESNQSIDLIRYISKGADLMHYQGADLIGLQNHRWTDFKI